MAEIFISYARCDEPHAERVVTALRGEGYKVWRDDELPAHRAYSEVIQERLLAAKAVVVLWSETAAKSQWVRAEADTARTAGTLIQVVLDATVPPLPFNQIQCANLADWDGRSDCGGWRKLRESVTALAGSPAVAATPRPRKASPDISVCVLPFANMSGDAEQEYFSDGISEDITTDLSKVSSLGVTARNTAFTFKGRAVNVCEVAATLGVTHVLEGSVRKAGDRVRITAQLIDGETGEHLWAERYDRDLTDIFCIQDEISKSIVNALKIRLLPEEKKAIEQRGTTNAEAYKLYLLARQYWVTGNYGDIRREQRVMRISSRAVEIDPYYAQAWALLANAQSNLRYGFGAEVEDGVAAAHTALAIDPTIAEAHCPMARRLEERGQYDEADAQVAKALILDPNSWEVIKEAARICMRDGRTEDALPLYQKAADLMPSDLHARAMLMTCQRNVGNDGAASEAAAACVALAEQVLAKDPGNGAAMSFGARAFATLGRADNAKEWMERAMLIDFDNLNMRLNFARMLASQLNDPDAALKLLQRNFSAFTRYQLKVAESDPDFATLREDARFENMVARTRSRLGLRDGTPLAAMIHPPQSS